jgi:hypothetical protein
VPLDYQSLTWWSNAMDSGLAASVGEGPGRARVGVAHSCPRGPHRVFPTGWAVPRRRTVAPMQGPHGDGAGPTPDPERPTLDLEDVVKLVADGFPDLPLALRADLARAAQEPLPRRVSALREVIEAFVASPPHEDDAHG